ncbi:MAG: response regulator transcription factor [Myxococcales bacterium]|nr:MAG: response regulator transcription factor [Myxococcales bacterium]
MDRIGSAIIDFTEAAYDLEPDDEEWLPTVLRRGLPVLDQGLGVACMEYELPPEGGAPELKSVHVGSGPEDFVERHLRALQDTPPEVLREQLRPGGAGTASVDSGDNPEQLEHYTNYVDYCRDLLYITAVDCRGEGVAVVAPLAEVTSLTPQESQRWQMLAAHLEAGHRLRRGLAAKESADETPTDLPHDAEAIFDVNSFRISDAVGQAKDRTATKKLREAAIAVDRARGKLRKDDPDKALEIWKALVRGRWSTVDWFDTDGRRFVLAVPNSPHVTDPRGLTERERQVVTYAAVGQTNKMIGYRLGLSKSRVSLLLRSAMRKMDVPTRAALVKRVRDFEAFE